MDGSGEQPSMQTTNASEVNAGDERVEDVPPVPPASAARATSKFLPFKHALLRARSLKLKNMREWIAWSKTGARPANVPCIPHRTYKHNGWHGYGHWLGTGNVGVKKDQQFLPFKEALLHARSLKLKCAKEWQAWCKSRGREANVPSNPHRSYKHEGWQGHGHWLGTGNVLGGKKQEFLPYEEALLYARSLKLNGLKEWRELCETGVRPANIPSNPDKAYKHDEWQGWGHWLGTSNVAPKDQQFLPFKEALLHARSLNLKGQKEWYAWSKIGARTANVPACPQRTYKHDGWQGWGHWLGTGNVAPKDQQFLPFKKAVLYARSLKLKSEKEWREWCKSDARPQNIASTPDRTYKQDGWQGYGNWLGTGNVPPKGHHFLPFKKALLYARSLNLQTQTEWCAFSKSGARPANIPSAPQATYKHAGWQGHGYWLGTS